MRYRNFLNRWFWERRFFTTRPLSEISQIPLIAEAMTQGFSDSDTRLIVLQFCSFYLRQSRHVYGLVMLSSWHLVTSGCACGCVCYSGCVGACVGSCVILWSNQYHSFRLALSLNLPNAAGHRENFPCVYVFYLWKSNYKLALTVDKFRCLVRPTIR